MYIYIYTYIYIYVIDYVCMCMCCLNLRNNNSKCTRANTSSSLCQVLKPKQSLSEGSKLQKLIGKMKLAAVPLSEREEEEVKENQDRPIVLERGVHIPFPGIACGKLTSGGIHRKSPF